MPVVPLPPTDVLIRSREAYRSGRITVALQILEKSFTALTEPERPAGLLACLLEVRLARGELTRAGELGDRLVALEESGPDVATVSQVLGELATARGEHEGALSHYTDAGARLASDADDLETVPWRSGSALALTRLGRHRQAARLAVEHLRIARAHGSAYAVAHALRTAAATDANGHRLRLLREARATLAGTAADRLAAQVDTDLAVLLTLQPGGTEEAVSLLRSAEEYAGREDLFPLQQRVRRTLERLGEQPRLIQSETLASLTATEQTAASLAAGGLTNRQIAAQLGVTVKAVEWHLSHVYRKLGIHSRTALPDLLGAPA